MTPQQVQLFKRSQVLEDLAKNMYYATATYYDLDWPIWVPGLRCANVEQHERQQCFRHHALSEMVIAQAGADHHDGGSSPLHHRAASGHEELDHRIDWSEAVSRVAVTLHPFGEFVAPHCAVDEFTIGIATITSLYDGRTVKDFQSHEWLSATAYDEHGHIMYWFPNAILAERVRQAAYQLKMRQVA